MAQASSQWQQLISSIQDLPSMISKIGDSKQISLQQFKGSGGWFVGSAAVIAMIIWNWKLFSAIGSGLLIMLLVYLAQEGRWQIRRPDLSKWLGGANRSLLLAGGSGAIAMLSTYIAMAIWADSESHWIATGALLQGAGTLAVLLLLARQLIDSPVNYQEAYFNRLLNNLTQADSLKRLIAIRQITRFALNTPSDKLQHRAIADSFRLMLTQESEPLIRSALLDGLRMLNRANPQLPQGRQPLAIAPSRKRLAIKSRQVDS